LADPEQSIKAGVIKNIVEAFTLEVLKRRIILGTSMGILVAKNLINPAEIQQLITVWLSEIENIEELIQIDKKTEKRMDKNPLAMEYYAVGMGVMPWEWGLCISCLLPMPVLRLSFRKEGIKPWRESRLLR